MRATWLPVLSSLALASMVACGLLEDATDRLDSSEAEAVCEQSCDRQLECDDQFDVSACKSKCGASAAAWYLCPDAPGIADYIQMCNEGTCEDLEQCLNGRPDC